MTVDPARTGDPTVAGVVAERGAGGRWPVPDRSLIATVLGVPPVAAVGLAAGLTFLGVVVDLFRIGTLGAVFTVCYLGGCVLSVAWVRRRSLFAPMVSPPLLLAVAVPVVVLLAGSPRPGTGISERLITIGAPLVNSFPTMAWTTAAVLALGVGRILAQRAAVEAARPAEGKRSSTGRRGSGRATKAVQAAKAAKPAKVSGTPATGAARAATRKSASPPPS